jgi:hypothetical protein
MERRRGMSDVEVKREEQPKKLARPLPLVLEIIPGQAGEGLVVVMEPGSYEGSTLRELCQQALDRTDFSIEERQILEDIQRQLQGGKLLCQGRDLDSAAQSSGTVEETEAGEVYLYVPVRAIKPQEGGLLRLPIRSGVWHSAPGLRRDSGGPGSRS